MYFFKYDINSILKIKLQLKIIMGLGLDHILDHVLEHSESCQLMLKYDKFKISDRHISQNFINNKSL